MADSSPLISGSAQFLAYIRTWDNLRLYQVDMDPLHPDLNRIEVTKATQVDNFRFRLANEHLQKGFSHYRDLLTALTVDPLELKSAMKRGIAFNEWFWQQRKNLAWYHEDRQRRLSVLDDLLQLNRCLNQAADRVEQWEQGRFQFSPPGMEQHFLWLRHLLTSRARLAREALGIKTGDQSPARADVLALSIFFDGGKRRLFGVSNLHESLAEFFGLHTTSGPARSA